MKNVILLLVIVVALLVKGSCFAQLPPDKITRKGLGDINGDGKQEMVVTRTTYGASSYSDNVKILTGKKVVLALPGFTGDTADGYKVVGRKIVVWLGDWKNEESKWKPHYYNYVWYSWDEKRGQYMQSREGFTRKAFSYNKAKMIMSQFADKPEKSLIISRKPTFLEDARNLAIKKYGQRATRAKIEEELFVASEFHPPMAQYYMIHIDTGGEEYPFISLYRDGTWKVW